MPGARPSIGAVEAAPIGRAEEDGGAIEAGVLGQPTQPVRDPAVQLLARQVDELRGDLRDQALEAQPRLQRARIRPQAQEEVAQVAHENDGGGIEKQAVGAGARHGLAVGVEIEVLQQARAPGCRRRQQPAQDAVHLRQRADDEPAMGDQRLGVGLVARRERQARQLVQRR
jgi:hypothetical protein